jgi:hypothetical protein
LRAEKYFFPIAQNRVRVAAKKPPFRNAGASSREVIHAGIDDWLLLGMRRRGVNLRNAASAKV